jgi:hypothetical protein
VTLALPGDTEQTILLSAQFEVEQARCARPSPVATFNFCDTLKKAHEHLSSRAADAIYFCEFLGESFSNGQALTRSSMVSATGTFANPA